MYNERGIARVFGIKSPVKRKKGRIMEMVKLMVPQKPASSSIMSRKKYNVFISNPAKKGSSLMSMTQYNKDSGVIKNERNKSNND